MALRIELLRAAAEFQRRMPEEWATFMKELATERDSVISGCLSSPIDTLPVEQGRARMMAIIHQEFESAVKTVDERQRRHK